MEKKEIPVPELIKPVAVPIKGMAKKTLSERIAEAVRASDELPPSEPLYVCDIDDVAAEEILEENKLFIAHGKIFTVAMRASCTKRFPARSRH